MFDATLGEALAASSSNAVAMSQETKVQRRAWWKLGRLEQVALLLGAVIGLVAAAPLVWLSAEAHRTGHSEFTAAAGLYPTELLLVWLAGAGVGGLLAAQLVRRFAAADTPPAVPGHVLRLLGGILVVTILSPLPLALVAMLITRHPQTFSLYYLSSGGLIGWQPGVISFVFLYTFRALAERRT